MRKLNFFSYGEWRSVSIYGDYELKVKRFFGFGLYTVKIERNGGGVIALLRNVKSFYLDDK